LKSEKQIILFDGVCNFCNFWVNFVIKRDNRDIFRFSALQSDVSKEIIHRINYDISNPDTFVLIIGEDYYTKSTAALKVCKELSGMIKILYPIIILPKFFRDFVYDLIAKNRYKLFGKTDSCRIPTEEEKLKFLF
jgi:predicted DCC family thiol-disulfide oxidoreductase YuxK